MDNKKQWNCKRMLRPIFCVVAIGFIGTALFIARIKDQRVFESAMEISLKNARTKNEISSYKINISEEGLFSCEYEVIIRRPTNVIKETAIVKTNFLSANRKNVEFDF